MAIRTRNSNKPDIRYLYDLKKVLYDKKWSRTVPNFETYYMYRGVKRKNGLRYDITVLLPTMFGKEFPKTKGHYHPDKYGEIYTVLDGKAIYLMQKSKNGTVKDVYAVKAKKGNVVIIPPSYGHVTINPGKRSLKMANWVSSDFKSDYKPFEEKKGACYFFTKSGWIKNKNYKKIPKINFRKPLRSLPKNLEFLKGKKTNR